MGFETKDILSSFLKKSVMWTAAKIIQAAITFLIFYLYAFYLSKNDYGSYQKIFVLIGFLSGLLSFGFHTYIPVLPIEEFNAILRDIFRKAGWIISIASIMIVGMFYIILPDLPSSDRTLAIVIAIFNALNISYELFALKLSRDQFVLKTNIIFTSIYLLAHLMMLLSFSLSILLSFLVLLAVLKLVVYYVHCGKIIKLNKPDSLMNTTHYYQWIYIVLNEALDLLSRHIDKIVLIGLVAAADFAVYFNGSYEIPLLGLLVAVAGTFTNLHTIKYKLENHEIKALFHTITLLLATIVFPLFFFARQYAFPLFSWLFNDKYNDAVSFFLIYAWIIPLRINNYTAILLEKMKSRLVIAGNLSALILKIALMIVLYQLNGVEGIAIACVAGTFYQVLFYLFHISKSLSISFNEVFPFKNLIIIFIFSLIINLGSYLYLRNLPAGLQILGGSAIVALNAFLTFWFFVKKQINTITS